MSVLLLEPDLMVRPRVAILDPEVKVFRRLQFEDLGQKFTLIPHLLASGQSSLELSVDLIERGLGGEVYVLVDPLDRLVIQVFRSLGVKIRAYNLDIFVEDDERELEMLRKILNSIPAYSVLLSSKREIVFVSESFARTLPVDYSSVNLNPLLQNALLKADPDKGPVEVDILNFHGFCQVKQFETNRGKYLIAFLASNTNAYSVMSNFEIALNLLSLYFKQTSASKINPVSETVPLKGIISNGIQQLNEVLPVGVKISSNLSYDHMITTDPVALQTLVQCLLTKAVVTLGSECYLEIEILPKLETGEIVVYITGETKFTGKLGLTDFPFLKIVTEYLERIVSELDENIQELQNRLNIRVKWSLQTSRIDCSIKI